MADIDTRNITAHRACSNCVQIKVKCIPLKGSVEKICQRCQRLRKVCTTPAPVPRKARVKSTRVNQLEQRVDQLTELLASSQQRAEATGQTVTSAPSDRSSTAQSLLPAALPHRTSKPFEEPRQPQNEGISEESNPWASGRQPIARSGSPNMFVPHVFGRKDGSQLLKEEFCPVHLEAKLENRLFSEFRYDMIKSCHFVVIDDEISAAQYKSNKPFSYWAGITAASHRDRGLHQKLYEEMMKALGYRMLVAGAKNIDLLQGILLLIAWHHYIAHKTPQLMNLLHLAQALLADLGIGKAVRVQDRIRIASDTTAMMHGTETLNLTISSEERRALLGCYYLTSKAAFTFNRIDPMRYSQHIDDCCQSLKQEGDYESDLLLVELVQIHRMFGKYHQIDSGSATTSSAYRTMLQDEVQRYRQNLPLRLKDDEYTGMELYSNLVYFLEPNYTADYADNVERFHSIQTCLDVSTTLIDIITSIPPSEWPKRTLTLTMSIVQHLVVLCRLSFIRSDNWNMEGLSRTANFGDTLRRLQIVYERAHQHEVTAYPDDKPWMFDICAKKAQHIMTWYETKVAAEEAALSSAANEGMSNVLGDLPIFDDSMWNSLMSDWMEF